LPKIATTELGLGPSRSLLDKGRAHCAPTAKTRHTFRVCQAR